MRVGSVALVVRSPRVVAALMSNESDYSDSENRRGNGIEGYVDNNLQVCMT